MIDVSQISDVLNFIIKDEDVFNQLQKDYPDILADLITFKNNPNCTCRGRVIKFFTEQFEKDNLVMNKYIKNPDSLKIELDRIRLERQSNNYSGKVFEIEKTPEAWRQFATETLRNKMFRGFSVFERENSVVIYLL